ncbi:sterol 3beta-glucosyltransferase [Wickerhamomyces ciferrii]|uniref:Sterol 3-beta-glucosyltransferase n=1 Tax=Wickerhamomyces ciferrii (strain ATCC 14091 / BCRC 22168 / CBS 111 / JCM 3599 / NBRC 0793 / NRRL Y-1031 F-60-10) TaxID=1206466 RepID=K0KV91_WICCF|nr:sterol 3beta-glucosyltransferase [Wickerhamomyces ciferrii]CCH45812.1 sterol 3beta-glucosyltransferase [Wickerhamomyces ciferrii]
MEEDTLPEERSRRSRSPTLERVNRSFKSASRSLAALSPPPVKRSLSPLASSLSRIGTRRSSSKSITDSNAYHVSKGGGGAGDQLDVAKPSGMAKSFVSMLTTASMYNGNLQDIIDEEEPVADSQIQINDTATEGNASDLDVDTEADTGKNHDQEEQQPIESKQNEIPTLEDFPSLERSPTLFEISIAQKLNQHSKDVNDCQKRAIALSNKLKSVFQINSNDIFLADFPCWLLKDVLLQGHIYLTQSHLLFFAFLQKRKPDKIALKGNLSMNISLTSPRQNRYWAVLKDQTFSLYNNSTDLYFPVLTIDLKNALRAEIITETGGLLPHVPGVPGKHHQDHTSKSNGSWFKILTETKSYKFQADSSHIARSWVGLLKKHIFASRNKGDSVSVKVPLQNILDLEETPIFESAETLKIKVLENSESFVVDDYFFMFFNSGPEFTKLIHEAIEANTNLSSDNNNFKIPENVVDSTGKLDLNTIKKSKTSNFFPLKKVLSKTRSRSNSNTSNKPISRCATHNNDEVSPPLSPISAPPTSSYSLQGNFSPTSFNLQEPVVEKFNGSDEVSSANLTNQEDVLVTTSDEEAEGGDVEPEDFISKQLEHDNLLQPKDTNKSSSLLPAYINPGKALNQAKSSITKFTPKVIKSASFMWQSNPVHYEEENSLERGLEDEFLATPKERIEANKRFLDHFTLPENNFLIAAYYAHLQRNVPIYGKVYLGVKEICFRSLVPGFHTKMILPYKDIENIYKEKGFKFGYSGLVIVIHGHEELFFEFSSNIARDDCEFLLLKQLDKFNSTIIDNGSNDVESALSTSGKLQAAKIQYFEDKIHSDTGFEVPIMIEDHPLMKTSIKPSTPRKFTLLTIGSRGDVQPYIALGLGLKKEGHIVRIVTHKEFEDWILKHGLEFKEIAGNPTELMSLMVSHGSMNVGLIKEASSKFRGWITELLNSSWEACQDTDILIESPSAMGGIHIAEALNIPYLRAFTMPWTRTRAYPHAFIVPEQKKGGSYNYLTHVLFENVFWKGISGQVNKWRKEVLNLPKTNLDVLQQNKVPFLYNISPTVFPPPVDFNDWVKVTGYWFLDEAIDYKPPKDLIDFINQARIDGKKLVYIGFGSIVVSNPKELTEAVVEAVLESDVRCILNKGWSERLGGSNVVEIELPYEVFNSGSLPHDWLFPQIDAAVHHGGSGTTGATLRAGLPTIIKPFFADQFFYANRVEDIGAGIGLKKLNVKTLSKALKEATTNIRMINKAKIIGEKIRKENGVTNAIETIYRELEYAKELVNNKKSVIITNEEEELIDEDSKSQIMNINEIDDVAKQVDEDKDLEEEGSWLLV